MPILPCRIVPASTSHIQALSCTFTCPIARQYLGGPVSDSEALQRANSLCASDRHLPAWAIIPNLQGDEDAIGFVSLDQHHDIDDIEISYALLPEAWGKGYASQAISFALSHAFTHLGLNRVVAETQTQNKRSIRLLLNAGMKIERELIRFNASQILFALLADEKAAKVSDLEFRIQKTKLDP